MMLKTRWMQASLSLPPSVPNPSLPPFSVSLGPSHFVIVYFSDQALKPAEIVSVFGFVGRMDRSFVRGFSHKLQVTLSKSGSLGSRPIPKRCGGRDGGIARGRGEFTQPLPKPSGQCRIPPLPCHCERVSDESG